MGNQTDTTSNNLFASSIAIKLEDGGTVVPYRIRDKKSGEFVFKVSSDGNTNGDAISLTDEAEMVQYVKGMGYQVRCKRRDGKRSGLFSPSFPNQIILTKK